MGAAASVVKDSIPENLKPLYDLCHRWKLLIADLDAKLIDAESKKMFKGHNNIIQELTARSKPQIKLMLDNFPESGKNLDTLLEAGNHYAGFIKLLAKPKAEIEIESLKAGKDIDEELLVNILGTSTIADIEKLNTLFMEEKTYSIGDHFASKCKDESLLKKFVARIMQLDRDESKDVDMDLVMKQVDILHRAGASRLVGVDEDPIIEILSSASRTQCAAINDYYQEKYRMKLERAINIKFKGNCGKLMVLWTQPLPISVITCIGYLSQKMLVDKMAIGQLVARFDKDFWQQAEEACPKLGHKSLSEVLGKCVSGTYHKALAGWVESATPDKGYERILELYTTNKFPNGVSNLEAAIEKDTIDKFHFLLMKQAQELKHFMIAHKVKVEAADLAILAKNPPTLAASAGNSHAASSRSLTKTVSTVSVGQVSVSALSVDHDHDDHEEVEPLAPSPPKPLASASAAKPVAQEVHTKFGAKVNPKDTAEHEAKAKKVYNYLVEVMEAKDPEGEGFFPEQQFWEIVKTLPLDDLGMTEEEIDGIREWSEWEIDGNIYYYETLFELSESMIAAIESKVGGDTDVHRVIESTSTKTKKKPDEKPAELSKASSRKSVIANSNDFAGILEKKASTLNQFPSIPLYVRQYIMDTITAFDLDLNGHITEEEIVALLQVINIPSLTTEHFFSQKVSSFFSILFLKIIAVF